MTSTSAPGKSQPLLTRTLSHYYIYCALHCHCTTLLTLRPRSTYDGDELLATASDFLCPTYVPDGQECALPLGPGQYGGGDPLVVTLPEIPSIIGDLLASGTYYAQATVKLADGSDMTCIWVRVQLVGH